MKLKTLFLVISLSLLPSLIVAKEKSKGYTPYQFEPEIYEIVEKKIPIALTKYHDDLVVFHLENMSRDIENMELKIMEINDDSFDFNLDNLLSSPNADQIKPILDEWYNKHSSLTDDFYNLFKNTTCVSVPIMESYAGGSYTSYGDVMRYAMLTLAFKTSQIKEKQIPQNIEAEWIKISTILTKGLDCDISLIGNIIHTALYGSFLTYISSFDHKFSIEGFTALIDQTQAFNDLVSIRKKITFQERYATLVGLDMIYKVYKNFLNATDKAIKTKFGDKTLDEYTELVESEGIDRRKLFDIEGTIKAIDKFYSLVTMEKFKNQKEYEAMEKDESIKAFMEKWELTSELNQVRRERIKRSLTFFSKFKRFVGLESEDQLKNDMNNLFGKLSLSYLISSSLNYIEILSEHEKLTHAINAFRIKLHKKTHGRLPELKEIKDQLIPYSIESIIPVIDKNTQEFIYQPAEDEPIKIKI